MKNITALLLTLTIITCSCKVISKQETKDVQLLAKAAKASSILQPDFTKKYYEQVNETRLLETTINLSVDVRMKAMDDLIREQDSIDHLIKLYSKGYSVLSRYADLLSTLSDDSSYSKSLNKQAESVKPTFTELISEYNKTTSGHKISDIKAAALNGLAIDIIKQLGSVRIKTLQRKYISQLVLTSNDIIIQLCDEYESIDFYLDKNRIDELQKDIETKFKTFLISVELDRKFNSPYYYQNYYLPEYIRLKTNAKILANLSGESSKAFKAFKKSHQSLANYFSKKENYLTFVKNLQELSSYLNSLKDSYMKLQSSSSPSSSSSN